MLKYAGYIAAIVIALSAGAAFAQSGSTQTPAAPNASASAPTPPNSAPAGAMTTNPGATPYVGSGVTTRVSPATRTAARPRVKRNRTPVRNTSSTAPAAAR